MDISPLFHRSAGNSTLQKKFKIGNVAPQNNLSSPVYWKHWKYYCLYQWHFGIWSSIPYPIDLLGTLLFQRSSKSVTFLRKTVYHHLFIENIELRVFFFFCMHNLFFSKIVSHRFVNWEYAQSLENMLDQERRESFKILFSLNGIPH